MAAVMSRPVASASDGELMEEHLLSMVHQLKTILEAAHSTSEEKLLAALKELRALGALPSKLLADSKVGVVAHSLAKDASLAEVVRTSARELVRAWRQEYRKRHMSVDGGSSSSRPSSPQRHSRRRDMFEFEVGHRKCGSQGRSRVTLPDTFGPIDGTSSAANSAEIASCLFEECSTVGGLSLRRIKVRQKLIETLDAVKRRLEFKATKTGVLSDSVQLAIAIEDALYSDLVLKSERLYLNQSRSVIFNLKSNESFCHKVMIGSLKPHELPEMAAEEMASDCRQAERARVRHESLEALTKSEPEGEFICEVCQGTVCRRTLGEVR